MNGPDLRSVLLADLAHNWRHRGRSEFPTGWRDVLIGLSDPRFVPVLLVRLSAALVGRGRVGRVSAMLLAQTNRLLFGVECALQCQIGPGLYFPHTGGIVIGASSIGANAVIYHQTTLGAQRIDMPFTPALRPRLGDDVTVAAGAKVLGPVVVGDGAVVAANAVAVHDVAARTVVGGIPARPLHEDSSA